MPAAGQGIVGITVRAGDDRTAGTARRHRGPGGRAVSTAERALLAALDGSCRTPIGGHARLLPDGQLHLTGLVARRTGASCCGAPARPGRGRGPDRHRTRRQPAGGQPRRPLRLTARGPDHPARTGRRRDRGPRRGARLAPVVAPLLVIPSAMPAAAVRPRPGDCRHQRQRHPGVADQPPSPAAARGRRRHRPRAGAAGFEQVRAPPATPGARRLAARVLRSPAGPLLLATVSDQGTALASNLRAAASAWSAAWSTPRCRPRSFPAGPPRLCAGALSRRAVLLRRDRATGVRLLQARALRRNVRKRRCHGYRPARRRGIRGASLARIRVAARPNQDAMLALLR